MRNANTVAHRSDPTRRASSLGQRTRLNNLIADCNDDARVHRDAAAALSNDEQRPILLAISRYRVAFADDLSHFARLLGGRIRAGGLVAAMLRRWLLRLRTFGMGGSHAGDTLGECAHAETSLLRHYDGALRASWSDEVRTTLASQRADVERQLEHVRALRASL